MAVMWCAAAVAVAASSADLPTPWHWGFVRPLVVVLPWLFLATALVLMSCRMAVSASWAMVVALSWTGAMLAASSFSGDSVRSAGLYVAPWLMPGLVGVVLASTTAAHRSTSRRALTSLLVVVGVVGTMRAAVYDPFYDVRCRSYCGSNTLLVHANPELAARLLVVRNDLAIIAVIAVGVVAIRARELTITVRLPALVGLTAVPASAMASALGSKDAGRTTDLESLAAICATVVAVVAGTVAGGRLLRLVRVRRVATSLAGGNTGCGLETGLRAAVGDPELRVVYPLVDGRGMVCADGSDDVPVPGRTRTALRIRNETVAVVEHDTAVAASDLQDRFGDAARMAAWNEGLRANLLHRLEALRSSRRRIVAAADVERRRIERDLHDGAQQDLLALLYELRGARRRCSNEVAGVLDDALQELQAAQRELRELAARIYPAVVADAGLDAALHHLAERAARPVELHVEGVGIRGVDAAHAVYRLVEHAVTITTDLPLSLRAWTDGAAVVVEARGVAAHVPEVMFDGVRAIGGSTHIVDDDWKVLVPCES